MSALRVPAELWLEAMSFLAAEYDNNTIISFCLVCKTFCAIGQPFLFRYLSLEVADEPFRLEETLCGNSGIKIGSYARIMDISVALELLSLNGDVDWAPVELQMAAKRTESLLSRAMATMQVCPNIESLSLQVYAMGRDARKKSVKRDIYVQGWTGRLPRLRSSDLLSLPCLPNLRRLCLVACRFFDTQAFGQLIAAADQLEVLQLSGVAQPELLVPLQKRSHPLEQSQPPRLSRLILSHTASDAPIYPVLKSLDKLPTINRLEMRGPTLEHLIGFNANSKPTLPALPYVTSLILDMDASVGKHASTGIGRLFPNLDSLSVRMAYAPFCSIFAPATSHAVRLVLVRLELPLPINPPADQFRQLAHDIRNLHTQLAIAAESGMKQYRLTVDLQAELLPAAIADLAAAAKECISSTPSILDVEIKIGSAVEWTLYRRIGGHVGDEVED